MSVAYTRRSFICPLVEIAIRYLGDDKVNLTQCHQALKWIFDFADTMFCLVLFASLAGYPKAI